MKPYLTLVLNLHQECNQSKKDYLLKIIERDKHVKQYMYHHVKDGKLPSDSQMNKLFLSTKDRKKVKYDVKKQFTLISREYQEIRKNVRELLKSSKSTNCSVTNHNEATTRRMDHQQLQLNGKYTTGTCRIIVDPTNALTKLWLMVYNPFKPKKHLKFPLEENSYLNKYFQEYQIDCNSVKTIHITKKNGTFTVNLTFNQASHRKLTSTHARVTTYHGKSTSLQQLDRMIPLPTGDTTAILGLDPGLRIPFTGCWVLPDFDVQYDLVRYYSISRYQRKIDIIDERISQKQQNLYNTREANKVLKNPEYLARISTIKHQLQHLRKVRQKVRQEAEVELAKLIHQEAELWERKRWDVKIVVGYPHSVNTFSSKQKVRSRRLRRQTSRWNYKSRPEIMQKVFASFGKDNVFPISENYTSKTCWKCGITEFRNFRNHKAYKAWGKIFRHGGYFACKNRFCGWSGNADLNGAINITKRYILTEMDTPSNQVLINHCKRKTWHLTQQRAYQDQIKRNKSSNSSFQLQKYKPKKVAWEKLKKQKAKNTLYWCEYPADHLTSFKWITTRPHPSVPRYAEIYDKSILCQLVYK